MGLSTGFPVVDPNWTWVARRDGAVVAVLLAASCHGALMILRIVAAPEAGRWWLRGVLRACARDCRERELTLFFTYLDTEAQQAERKLAKLIRRGLHKDYVFTGALISGPVERFA